MRIFMKNPQRVREARASSLGFGAGVLGLRLRGLGHLRCLPCKVRGFGFRGPGLLRV